MQQPDWYCTQCGFYNMGLCSACTNCKAVKEFYQDDPKLQFRNCPCCNHRIAPQAVTCPACGQPLNRLNQYLKATTDSASGNKAGMFSTTGGKVLAGLLVLLMVGIAMQVFESVLQYNNAANKTGSKETQPLASPSVNPVENMSVVEKLSHAKNTLKDSPGISELEEAIALLKQIPRETSEFTEAEKLQKKAQAELAQQNAILAIVGEIPTTSAWDGQVDCVDRYLRTRLNDYDSAEYLSWKGPGIIRSSGQLYWGVRLRLRAKNAFGGNIIKEPLFYIRHEQVVKVQGL